MQHQSLFDAAVCKLRDTHSFRSYSGILVLFFIKSPEIYSGSTRGSRQDLKPVGAAA